MDIQQEEGYVHDTYRKTSNHPVALLHKIWVATNLPSSNSVSPGPLTVKCHSKILS